MDENINKTTLGCIGFPGILVAFACSVLIATGLLGGLLWFNIYIWSLIF